MTYHFLPGNILHLSPGIIKEQVFNINRLCPGTIQNHCFCVIMYYGKMLYDNIEKNPYTSLFKELGIDNYKLLYSRKELKNVIRAAKVTDKIIFHKKLLETDLIPITIYLLLFKYKLLKRCSLIAWGEGDFTLEKIGIKRNVINLLLSYSYSKYKYIYTISSDDYKLAKLTHPKANIVSSYYIKSAPLSLNLNQETKGTVMVSHSGWPHNYHIESFKLLSKHAGKINVLCPLCYGDKEYIEKVICEGRRIFGDRFHYFTDLMPYNEYKKLLSTVDVFVSSAKIQTGLGAITCCIAGGCRLYLSGNLLNTMKEQGYIVDDITSIQDIDTIFFNKKLSNEEALHNVNKRNMLTYDGILLKEQWINMFNY